MFLEGYFLYNFIICAGISILYNAPQKLPPTAFLEPFSGSLWLCIGVAYLFVSVTLFVVARYDKTLKNWKIICYGDNQDLLRWNGLLMILVISQPRGNRAESVHKPFLVVGMGSCYVDGV